MMDKAKHPYGSYYSGTSGLSSPIEVDLLIIEQNAKKEHRCDAFSNAEFVTLSSNASKERRRESLSSLPALESHVRYIDILWSED